VQIHTTNAEQMKFLRKPVFETASKHKK